MSTRQQPVAAAAAAGADNDEGRSCRLIHPSHARTHLSSLAPPSSLCVSVTCCSDYRYTRSHCQQVIAPILLTTVLTVRAALMPEMMVASPSA